MLAIDTMRRSFSSLLILVGGIFCSQPSLLGAQELEFNVRLEAQTAIERVRYSYQLGTHKPFEQAVSDELLEKKVRTYLKQSLALEQIWGVSLTQEALDREVQRLQRESRLPIRLSQIQAALNHDPILFRNR